MGSKEINLMITQQIKILSLIKEPLHDVCCFPGVDSFELQASSSDHAWQRYTSCTRRGRVLILQSCAYWTSQCHSKSFIAGLLLLVFTRSKWIH